MREAPPNCKRLAGFAKMLNGCVITIAVITPPESPPSCPALVHREPLQVGEVAGRYRGTI
jgi:hypothetical protein